MVPPTEVERAYQMARSGRYTSLAQIIMALKAEGYTGHQLVDAFALRAELRDLMNPDRKRRRGRPRRTRLPAAG